MEKKRNGKERKGKGGGEGGTRCDLRSSVRRRRKNFIFEKPLSFLREWKGEKEKSHISIGPLNALSSLRRRRLSPLVQRKAKEESIIASIQQREERGAENFLGCCLAVC